MYFRVYQSKVRKSNEVYSFNHNPISEYELQLENKYYGSVEVRHFDLWGYVCADGFDDNDAMVVCRELNFKGGFAYNQYKFRYILHQVEDTLKATELLQLSIFHYMYRIGLQMNSLMLNWTLESNH